ncbi:hypothetical protein CR088_30185, partial [Salmonella enterica subsp. enterica serovar Dublin]
DYSFTSWEVVRFEHSVSTKFSMSK